MQYDSKSEIYLYIQEYRQFCPLAQFIGPDRYEKHGFIESWLIRVKRLSRHTPLLLVGILRSVTDVRIPTMLSSYFWTFPMAFCV